MFHNTRRPIKRSVFQGSVPSVLKRQSSSDYQRRSDYAKSVSPGVLLQGQLSQCKVLVLLKNVTDKNQFSHLARQVYPEDSGSLYEAYLDATKQPHEYFLLDPSQDTDDLLRFRANIFPKEYLPVIYAPVSDETDEVQLSRATSA